MGQIILDSALWPVVLVRFPASRTTDDELEQYLAGLTRLLDNCEPYTTVTDTTRIAVSINAKQQARVNAFVDDHAAALERYSLGNALVVSSALIQGALTAIYWFRRPPNPHTVVTSVEEGAEWCLGNLLAARVLSEDEAEARRRLFGGMSAAAASPSPKPEPAGVAHDAAVEAHGAVMDMFEESAFLVASSGEVVFSNRAAKRQFGDAPEWLAQSVSLSNPTVSQLCRISRLGADPVPLYLVIPCEDLLPPAEDVARRDISLPPSLKRIATLLAHGYSDKEIAQRSDVSLSTVRTYVTRIFQRMEVHSRGEFIRIWTANKRFRS